MITTLEVAKKTGVSVKTLSRWAERGIIPKPGISTHPNGRGKIGYWPDHVLARCRQLVALRKQGHDLDTAAVMLGLEKTRSTIELASAPTMADILSRKKIRLKSGDEVDLLQVFFAAIAADVKQSPVDRDYHKQILGQIRAQELHRFTLSLIQNGFNPVLTFDGQKTRVEPDFLLSHVHRVPAFLAVPLRPAFCRFMEAIGAKEMVREPATSPAPKVWVRQGDVITEYAVYLGGSIGFELISETAAVVGTTRSDHSDSAANSDKPVS